MGYVHFRLKQNTYLCLLPQLIETSQRYGVCGNCETKTIMSKWPNIIAERGGALKRFKVLHFRKKATSHANQIIPTELVISRLS